MDLRAALQTDVDRLERREIHLWILTLLLLFIFLSATLISIYILVSRRALTLTFDLSTTVTACVGLVILTGLFTIYVLNSRANFARMRRLFSSQAMRDPLTGLLNRQSFDDRIGAEMARSNRQQGLLAFLLCDLDNFKQINDTLGHHVGDAILQRVAEAMQRVTRGSDLVFRWGGDEILVVLSLLSRDGVVVAAERVRGGLARLEIGGTSPIDVTIGAALYPEHSQDTEQLLKLANRALRIAKRGGWKIHVGEDQYPVNERAVNLVFQPIADVLSRQIVGHEALSRDPSGQLNIEELFLRYRTVGQLGLLKKLIFSMQLRRSAELGLSRVFLNVGFDLLESMQPPPKPADLDVVLEISEREVVDDIETHLSVTDRWKRRGYKFAIDDFGSGFISLPFISQLVPSYIKMNRSTLLEAKASEDFSQFLRDMVLAIRNYSREGVIAEGVETENELVAARNLGVGLIQGYLTGRPESLDKDQRSTRRA